MVSIQGGFDLSSNRTARASVSDRGSWFFNFNQGVFFMQLQCYAIKDIKTGIFRTPFFARNVSEALRQIAVLLKEPSNLLSQFSSDFELVHLWDLDDETGLSEVVSFERHHVIFCHEMMPQVLNGSKEPIKEVKK